MRTAAGALAILAGPVVVWAIDPNRATWLYPLALGVYLSLGLSVLVLSFTLRPARGPDRSIDEPALDRRQTFVALLGALVTANFCLIFDARLTPYICGFAIVWTLIWLPPFMRRIGVTTQVVIDRDQKTMFTFMLDGRNQMRYVPDLVSVEKITDGDVGPGTQFRSMVRLDSGDMFDGVEEIVDVEWGQRIVDRVANGTRPNRGVITLAPEDRGTLMTYRFESEVSYSGALMGQGVMRWALTSEMRRRRLAIWARLKQYLESRPDA